MSAVDGMLDAIWERKERNGEPCRDGLCGRTQGVWSDGHWTGQPGRRGSEWVPGGTQGACPTDEPQRVLWLAWWAAWDATHSESAGTPVPDTGVW